MIKSIYLILASIFLLAPFNVNASNYGDCNYGESYYNSGCNPTPNSNSFSPSSPTICNDQAPGVNASIIYSADSKSPNSILLYFTPADIPISNYPLEYGTKSGEYRFGVVNLMINSRSNMTYLVESLSPNTKYFFRITGQNGCATGKASNEISATTKNNINYNSLDLINSEFEISKSDKCTFYEVKQNDTLWSISKKVLGSGDKYQDIIKLNKDTYPNISYLNNLKVGWNLKINCESYISSQFNLRISIIDINSKPVEGVKILLKEGSLESTTNSSGVVIFDNIEAGEYTVDIIYNDYIGKETIYLKSSDGNIDYSFKFIIDQKNLVISNKIKLFSIMLLTILIVSFIKITKRKNYQNK